jgi:hypothetical protein
VNRSSDVPDYVDGGFSVLGESVKEPTMHVEEDPEEESMCLSLTISCSVKAIVESS